MKPKKTKVALVNFNSSTSSSSPPWTSVQWVGEYSRSWSKSPICIKLSLMITIICAFIIAIKAHKPKSKHLVIHEFPSIPSREHFDIFRWYHTLDIMMLRIFFSISDFYVKVRIQPPGRGWGHLWRCAMDRPGGFSSCGLFTRYFAGWYFLRVFGQYWGFLWRGAHLHPQMSHSRWLPCFYSSILQVLSLC